MKTTPISVHVLHTESLYSRGGEKYLFELLKRLTSRCTIHLYLHAISPDWLRIYSDAGIRVTTLWRPARLFWPLLPLTLAINILELRARVRSGDVVFATNFPMNFLAVLISKRAICHCFEPLAIFYDPIRIRSLSPFSQYCVAAAKFLYAHFDKWAYRKTAILTALGPTVAPHIISIYGRDPDVYLPNGVDTNFFTPRKSHRAPMRRVFRIGHSTDYTIFKGTDDFLSILARFSSLRIPFHASISESITDKVVKRRYMDFIRKHGLSRHVTFTGNIRELDFPDFYRSLDVFVYTGSPESAGGSTASLSVLEAQACGTPVIRSGGDDREILSGKTGYYIDPHDHVASASALAKFLRKETSVRIRFKKSAQTYVKAHFNWEVTSRVLFGIVRRLKSL